MLAPRYLFTGTWDVLAPPRDVFDALYRVLDYPRWWPEFREVTRAHDGRYRMIVRSFLPYRIRYFLKEAIVDRSTGRLEGTVEGDIDGRIGWLVEHAPGGTVVRFREEVETRMDLLNLLAPVARPAFEFNHRLMMRDGLVGLSAYLAGRVRVPPEPRVRHPGEGYR